MDLYAWWVLGLGRIPPLKDMRLWKPACLHGLLACQLWQREAVLLSSSHVSQPCHYLRNCYGFWETVWAHNHPPVKEIRSPNTAKRKYTSMPRNAHMCTSKCMYVETHVCNTHVCSHVKKGLLPNIMAPSTLSVVAVCINTSGQYNFTHRHLHPSIPP